jgi:O-antigen/teichoic acid export membrane protein
LLTTILNPLYLLFQTYLQTKQDGKSYGINASFYAVLNIALTVIFLTVFNLGILGILYANLITSAVFLVYVLFYFVPKISVVYSKTILKKSLKYSFPLIPHSLSGWIIAMIDKLFINSLVNTAQVGIFSIGFQFGNIVNIITSAVTQAYAPWFFGKLEQGKEGIKDIVKFTEIMTVVYSILGFAISLFSQEVLELLVTEKFREGWRVIPFISFAYVLNGIYSFFIATLFIEKTKFVPIVTFSSAILSVILNLVLIPQYGYMGSAIASIISLGVSSIIALLFSLKFRRDINHKWGKMYTIVLVFFALSLVAFIPNNLNILSILLIKSALFLLVFIIVFYIYKKSINNLKGIFIKS